MPPSTPVPRRVGPVARVALILLAPLVLACDRTRADDAPPSAEFLLSAGDSLFWVTSGPEGAHLRGSPMLLTRVDGRFVEIYVADDDRSYHDAVFVGERVYRRDLVSGDSAVVFDDPSVSRLAQRYADDHPDERPLLGDEDGSEDPATVATVELDVVDVHGPYLSLDHRVNVDVAGSAHQHSVRRTVVDVRTGARATLAALFGDSAAARLAASGRVAFQALRDSLHGALRTRPEDGAPDASASLRALAFDAESFGLAALSDAPAVVFSVPGQSEGGEALVLDLAPIPAPAPAWWTPVRAALPQPTTDATADRWLRRGYELLARYDAGRDDAALVLRRPGAAGGPEWPVARVPAPVHQLHALDQPPVDSVTRRALARAFNESTLYDEAAVSVRWSPRRAPAPRRSAVTLVRFLDPNVR